MATMVDTAVILAGGRASRMGVPKTGLDFGGGTLLEFMVEKLSRWFGRVIVVGECGTPIPRAAAAVVDIFPGHGPLGGIHAGLAAAAAAAFVTACDMPFLREELVRLITAAADGADVIVPRSDDGKLHPLIAVYSPRCVSVIEDHLRGGRNKITDFYSDVAVRCIEECDWRRADPDARSLMNINTRDEYKTALRMVEM